MSLDQDTGLPDIYGQRVSQAEVEEEAGTMSEQRFPAGWDERRVRELLADLDARTESPVR